MHRHNKSAGNSSGQSEIDTSLLSAYYGREQDQVSSNFEAILEYGRTTLIANFAPTTAPNTFPAIVKNWV